MYHREKLYIIIARLLLNILFVLCIAGLEVDFKGLYDIICLFMKKVNQLISSINIVINFRFSSI